MSTQNHRENIVQWNCNGAKSHMFGIQKIISEWQPFGVCLQETHFRPEESFRLKRYNVFRKDDIPDQRAKGGVAILLKENIPASEVDLQTDFQAVAIQIWYPIKLTICNLYLPRFDWNSYDLTNLFTQLPKPCLIVGDFNSHSLVWGSTHTDTRGRLVEDVIGQLDLVVLNSGEGTYLNSISNSFSAIDLSMCSPAVAPHLRWTLLNSELYSDHIPINIEFAKNYGHKQYTLRRWNFKQANWSTFTSNFHNISRPTEDVEASVDYITNAITAAADASIPKTENRPKRLNIPWWNEEVKQAIRKKKRALNIFKKRPTQENLIEFKRLRACARRTILMSKRSSWEEYVSTITRQTTNTEIWNKTRAIMGKTHSSPPLVLLVDGKSVTDTNEIAETVASHFSKISSFSNCSRDFISYCKNTQTPLDFSEINTPSYYNDPITMLEFETVLEAVKDSAPGPDSIPYDVIRHLPVSVKENILRLYNKIWDTGHYPKQWKEAIIIPVSKPGKDTKNTNSYRPISLMCCLGKLLEKIVSNRLMWHLEKFKLLSDFQMGFRKHRSPVDQLVLVENIIQDSFAERKHTVAVFFDLQKAYDTTWRYGVLKSMYDWGIRGKLPLFVRSFLMERSFRVRVGDTLSQKHYLETGIPQGSTLSVTLFAIAVNNLISDVNPNMGYSLYVDDLVFFYSASSMNEIEETMQEAINNLIEKADHYNFTFSTEKTHCVHFCRLRKPHNDPNLKIKEKQLECKESAKFLGLILDKKLYWKSHIQGLVTQCKKRLDIIRCLSNLNWGADREVLIRLYKALIQSKIDYGSEIYASARQSHLKALDSVQTTGLRLASGAFRTSPYLSLCCETGVPPVRYRSMQSLINYGIRIKAQPNHPCYSTIFSEIGKRKYALRNTITRPVGVRLKETLQKFNIELPSVYPYNTYETPPWQVKKIKYCKEISNYKKNDTPSCLLKLAFLSELHAYQDYQAIYTDGSKTSEGVGSAFYTQGEVYSWTLPLAAGIFTAELYAIWQSLRYAEMSISENFIICSDSRSAMDALTDNFNNDPLVHDIHYLLSWLEGRNKNVRFMWVPGHIGIAGNERADESAREATHQLPEKIPIRADDVKVYMKMKILSLWQLHWSSWESKLKIIKPGVEKWKYPMELNRKEQVIIARLRIGHTNITSLSILKGEQPPVCERCGVTLNVQHILIDCPKHTDERRQHKLGLNLRECLSNEDSNIKRVLSYVRSINLLNKI